MSDEPSADPGLIARQQRQLLDQMNTMPASANGYQA
jgi:hypothetical protein